MCINVHIAITSKYIVGLGDSKKNRRNVIKIAFKLHMVQRVQIFWRPTLKSKVQAKVFFTNSPSFEVCADVCLFCDEGASNCSASSLEIGPWNQGIKWSIPPLSSRVLQPLLCALISLHHNQHSIIG